MTSMLLSASSVAAAACGAELIGSAASEAARRRFRPAPRVRGSAFLAAVARRDLLLARVLGGLLLDHLAHHRAVARHERRERLERLAVPLLEFHHPRAFVVETARLDGREQAGRAELLQAR